MLNFPSRFMSGNMVTALNLSKLHDGLYGIFTNCFQSKSISFPAPLYCPFIHSLDHSVYDWVTIATKRDPKPQDLN